MSRKKKPANDKAVRDLMDIPEVEEAIKFRLPVLLQRRHPTSLMLVSSQQANRALQEETMMSRDVGR